MRCLKYLAVCLVLKLAAADFTLKVECRLNCGESGALVNASEPVQLWCKCTGNCVPMKFRWHMASNAANKKTQLADEETLGLTEQRLVIKSNELIPKDSYEIYCEGTKRDQTKIDAISLQMHPCSSLYPCEETTIAPRTTTPTTTTTTVEPDVLLANITSEINVLSGTDVDSPAYHVKQQELLDTLKKLSYDDPQVVQQAANVANKIISASSAAVKPDTAERAAVVTEDLVNAELHRIEQSDNPAALAQEVQQLSKVLLNTISKTVNDNATQLVEHRTTETPVSSALDVGVYTENYPAYDDFDIEYQQKKANMEAVSHATINAVNNVALTNARTMTGRQPVERIIESDVCLLIIVQKPADIPGEPFEICNASVQLSEALRNEFAAKINTSSITFGVLRKNPFWWSLKHLTSDVVTLEVRDDAWKPILTPMKHPALVQAKFKPVQWEFVAGSVQIPRNTTTEHDDDMLLCIHQILVQEDTRTLMIEFKDMQSTDEIQVVIYENYSPSLENFKNAITIPTKQKSTDQYTIIHHVVAPSGSFIYIGVRALQQTIKNGGPGVVVDDTLYYNYTVHCARVSCVRWDSKHADWLEDYCTVGSETSADKIQCNCVHLSTFAGIAAHMESKIHRMVGVDVQLTRIYNYTALAAVTIVTLGYIIVLVIARWVETKRSKSKRVLFLLDNHLKAVYEYLVVVHTGSRVNAGTTANIGIKLHGTGGETESHLLRGQMEPVLQKGGEDWFLLLADSPLGDLTQVDLWTDCYGVRCSWYCKRLMVHHLAGNRRWTFKVNKWLSILNNNTFCSVPVQSADQREASTRWDYAKFGLHEHHLWMTLFKRSKSSAYTWREKATLIYAVLLINMFISFLFYVGTQPTVELVAQLGAGHYEFGAKDFGIACLSSSITFCISYACIYVFTNAVPLRSITSAEPHRFTLCRAWRCIVWISLSTFMATSVVMLVTFGFWFSQVTSLIWLTTATIAVILCAVVLETARVVYTSVMKQEVPSLFHLDAALDMSDVSQQKHTLLRRHGEVSMRPLFQGLYLPLSDTELKLKREKEIQRIELRNIVIDIIMFAMYLVILFCVVLINRDTMAHLSTKTIRDMFVENTFVRQMSLSEIDSVGRFFAYMRTTFLSAACANTWYGNWTTAEAGLTVDFNTKVLGVPRIRQVRIRHDSCTVPAAMQFVTRTCHAEFSSGLQSTMDFDQRWQPRGTNGSGSGRHTAVWLYQDGWQSHTSLVTGQLAYYPAGGYVVELGRTRQNILLVLGYLQGTHWVDHLTRALFIEVNFYNANQNLFNVLTLIVEKSATGIFLTSYSIHTSKLLFHHDELAISTSLTFTLFTIMILIFAWKRIKQLRRRFVADAWNIIDAAIILLAFSFLLVFYLRSQAVGQLLKRLEDAAHNEFVSFTHALAWDTWTTVLATLLVAVSTVRAWKLLRFLRFFRICELTLALAMKYLLAMAFSKFILLFAYSAWGYTIFSAYSRDFYSVFKSFASLILLSLGFNRTFDYTVLDRSYVGYVYYLSFMIILLVIINIYITIILVAYKTATDHFDNSDKEKMVSYNMAHYLTDEFRYFTDRRKGRQVMENLRAGEDVVVPADGIDIRHKPDAPRDVVTLNEARMKVLHRITAKVLQILIRRYDQRGPDTGASPNDDALITNILDHLVAQRTAAEEETRDEPSDGELYIVVPDEDGNKYCSKRRQDDMLVIVNYLLTQFKNNVEAEQVSRMAPADRCDAQAALLAGMNHRVERMIRRLETMSRKLVREFGTLARFEDFGLEIDESNDDIIG